MAIIIKGRISYTYDDGRPMIDLTEYAPERASSLSWKDEKAFLAWIKQRVKEIEAGPSYGKYSPPQPAP